jgi:hypothetical protein
LIFIESERAGESDMKPYTLTSNFMVLQSILTLIPLFFKSIMCSQNLRNKISEVGLFFPHQRPKTILFLSELLIRGGNSTIEQIIGQISMVESLVTYKPSV